MRLFRIVYNDNLSTFDELLLRWIMESIHTFDQEILCQIKLIIQMECLQIMFCHSIRK
jgi:hypothetical protein